MKIITFKKTPFVVDKIYRKISKVEKYLFQQLSEKFFTKVYHQDEKEKTKG